jgi:DNA-binding transcriptional LysR family regulator
VVTTKRGKRVEVEVTGSLITSDGDLAVRAAVDGLGLARVPVSSIETLVANKKLIPLLEDWTPASVGFFLYYPSRRQIPAPLQAFIDFVKAHALRKGSHSQLHRSHSNAYPRAELFFAIDQKFRTGHADQT